MSFERDSKEKRAARRQRRALEERARQTPSFGSPRTRSRKKNGTSARASSTARSIATSIWGRRFAWFLVLDMLLVVAFFGAVIWIGAQDMPDGLAFESLNDLFGAFSLRVSDPFDPMKLQLVVAQPGGTSYTLALGPHMPFAIAVGGALLAAEALALISGFSEARRIRRKLRPLNDLALTAEAIAARADQLENLEHAIEHASPDAPSISTGDKDLRSIEVALNSLLQRMREAQAQQARFVSDASHELRTPIAVIEGYVSMLDRWGKTDPAVLDESIAALKNESAHMKELVEQLLFLARDDSGRNALERAPFDAAALLRELADESQMIDADHHYELRGIADRMGGAVDASPLTLTADRAMVKQCLRVILQNAARYSPAGTTIELRLHRDKASGAVGFEIQDQGIGMTERDAAHVFERFYRADTARTRSEEGTGLGLAIAKWIADAHGGHIDVLSHEGLGTRFTVWLPL